MSKSKQSQDETWDGGLISGRAALIIAAGGAEAWLAVSDPATAGALATGVGVAYVLHKLIRRR